MFSIYPDCRRSDQIRFEDNCYEYASDSTPTDIISNIDACKAKGSDLWMPESSAEHHFVHQSFPGPASTDELYHLGIRGILGSEKGVLKGVDHSQHVGSPYFSLDSDLNSAGDYIRGVYQGNPTKRCLVYNKSTKLWEKQDPCVDAIGVCKSKLGRYFDVISLTFIDLNYSMTYCMTN